MEMTLPVKTYFDSASSAFTDALPSTHIEAYAGANEGPLKRQAITRTNFFNRCSFYSVIPAVIEALSYEAIFAEMAAELKVYFPDFNETRQSDPAVKIVQLYAYGRLLDRQRVNAAAKP